METRYDFDKETDREFLREAGKLLQEKVIKLEIEIIELKLQAAQDQEIKNKLTGELLILRKKIFDSRQERKERLSELKKRNKKQDKNLIHNRNENKDTLERSKKEIELESQDVEHQIKEKDCPCCSGTLNEIEGLFDESTEFDVNATYYILKRHKRQKYRCRECQKIVTAKGGDKLKPGSRFSVQMAAQVACDKFQHHIPLERQRVKMKGEGLKVSVKTLFSLTEHLYQRLIPLERMIKEDIFQGTYVCMDESPFNYYNPSKSKGYVWTLSNQIGAYYQFEPTRSGDVAKEMAHGYQGVVVSDGYAGYDFLSSKKGVVHAFCWSHVRRYFFNAMETNDRATEVVDLIDRLYEIEHSAIDLKDLKHQRETRSLQVYRDIVAWVDEQDAYHLSSTLTGKAISYFLNRKEGLEHFLCNEQVPLDNNAAERRQRCPVMGRKNFLFFRSINGADVGMFFYSLIETCKTNGLNPEAYIQEMALRAARKEELESPYRYASRLRSQVVKNLVTTFQEI